MRIIGYIDHPTLKITVFKMDTKVSVKFETGLCELTFKFREGELIESLTDVQAIVSPDFITAVEAQLLTMQHLRAQHIQLWQRTQASASEFETII